MKKTTRNKIITASVLTGALLFTAGSCEADNEVRQRQQSAREAQNKESLEKVNLRAKHKLEEDPNRVGYVYLISFGKPFGYYTVKGKISSSGSQLEPEDLILNPYSGVYVPTDGPQDDGTYGVGDPGIFFFTTEGVFVETSVDFFYATQPIPTALNIPKLG